MPYTALEDVKLYYEEAGTSQTSASRPRPLLENYAYEKITANQANGEQTRRSQMLGKEKKWKQLL